MAEYDYDLFVIGAGSGGVRCARMSAGYGARVAIAEERYLGGTCVNVGCVPKKLLVYAAHYGEDIEDARGYGWDAAAAGFDWPQLIAAKNAEIERLNGVYGRLLRDAGVKIIEGRARLADPHTVEIDGRRHTAQHILIATGGWPSVPDFPGREHVITSNEVFFLPQLPRRAAIVGGGYIAVEFAGIFNGLGCETHLLYRGPLFLRGFDDEARAFLAREMQAKGVKLHFDTEVQRIEQYAGGLRLHLVGGGHVEADTVLYATGRAPKVEGLGLEACGVELEWNGAVVVDEYYRSSTPSILAIGDVTHRLNLTPVAIAEGMALARTLYAGQPATVDYTNIPSCIFSQPNLGTVGLTEAQAQEHHGKIDVYRADFRPLKHVLSGRAEHTLMKLVVARETDCVVGVHMVGAEAGEIIQGMAIALKAGATKAVFDATLGIHPTAAEEFVTMRVPRGTAAQP